MHDGRGLILSREVTITDENGSPCCDPASQQRRHFTLVLNLCSSFNAHEFDLLELRLVFTEIASVPSARDFAVSTWEAWCS